jgi:uncharacterized protein (DUF1697 family)
MPVFVVLLRAVNVGGTGKLPMSDLKALCEKAGFRNVRTYIASGNVVAERAGAEAEAKAALEAELRAYAGSPAGKPISVIVRTAAEMAEVAALNPFSDRSASRTVAIFLDAPHSTEQKDKRTRSCASARARFMCTTRMGWVAPGSASLPPETEPHATSTPSPGSRPWRRNEDRPARRSQPVRFDGAAKAPISNTLAKQDILRKMNISLRLYGIHCYSYSEAEASRLQGPIPAVRPKRRRDRSIAARRKARKGLSASRGS